MLFSWQKRRTLKNWPQCYKSPRGPDSPGQLPSTSGAACSPDKPTALRAWALRSLSPTTMRESLSRPVFSSIVVREVPVSIHRFCKQKHILSEKHRRQWCETNGAHQRMWDGRQPRQLPTQRSQSQNLVVEKGRSRGLCVGTVYFHVLLRHDHSASTFMFWRVLFCLEDHKSRQKYPPNGMLR